MNRDQRLLDLGRKKDIMGDFSGFRKNDYMMMRDNESINNNRIASNTANAISQLVFDDQHFSTFYSSMANASASTTRAGYTSRSPGSPHHDDDDDESWNSFDNSREYMIRIRTENRESEYIRLEKYRIFIGTWNVNGQLSKEEKEMRVHFLAMDKEAPDFYAIGFQELDLSKEAYIFDNYNKESYWLRMCEHSLHPDKQYELLKSDRLIGMMLVVFANKKLMPYIHNVEAAHVGTGILGKMGNKGGVAIRFDLHETSICFVNCHLAAHVEQYERRNQDFREIRNRLQFVQPFRTPRRIDEHDQIFWFGDLNYRVMNLSTEQIKLMCDRGEYAKILEHDQLKRQKDLGACFAGYIEGPITHLPSYKYDPGTDNWDSSEKRRPPAWCDRILWHGKCKGIRQLVYRAHPQLKASDHKPVSAVFESEFRITDPVAKRKVYEDVMKGLDKEENDYLPQVEIDNTEINFGLVRYKDGASRSLKLKNVGQSKIKYRFINKPGEPSYCKDWLRITPATAHIAIQETVEIRLELNFDQPSLASRLNFNLEKLTDTLVLSLRGGKDIFITVVGEYRPSCFGCPLDGLVQLGPTPVASMSVAQLEHRFGAEVKLALDPAKARAHEIEQKKQTNLELLINLSMEINEKDRQLDQLLSLVQSPPEPQVPSISGTPACPIPKELYILVDYLFKYGAFSHDLFQVSGSEADFVRIREALDRSIPALMKGVGVDSVAEAMLLFLQALPQPVIPYQFYDRVLANRNNFSNCKQLIYELPPTHRAVFEYLLYFLKELCKFSHINRLDARMIARIFGPILVRKPADANGNNESPEPTLMSTSAAQGARVSPRSIRSNPSSSSHSTFYAAGSIGNGSSLHLSSSSSSSSLSSTSADHGAQIALTAEQTFIYTLLVNALD